MIRRVEYESGYNNLNKESRRNSELQESKPDIETIGLASRQKLRNEALNLDPEAGLDPQQGLTLLSNRFKKYREYSNNASTAREAMIAKARKEESVLSSSPVEGLMSKQAGEENIGQRLVGDISDALGLTDVQAAGIEGNFDHETGGFKFMQELKPVVPGSKGGLGFAQWTGPRRKAFESWAKENNLDTNTYEANFGFFIHEVQNTNEGRFLEDLQEAETVEESTRIVSEQYLRPGKPMMKSRLTKANTYLPGGQ